MAFEVLYQPFLRRGNTENESVMFRFFRNTLLYKQLAEIKETRRDILRSQHRTGIRLKRAAIRARILCEMYRLQAEGVCVTFVLKKRGRLTSLKIYGEVWLMSD